MLKSKNLQIAIFMVCIFGWEELFFENTNNGVTLSNEDEDCYCNLTTDEMDWLSENYPHEVENAGVEDLANGPLEMHIANEDEGVEQGGNHHSEEPLD